MKKTRMVYVLLEFPNVENETVLEDIENFMPFIVGVFAKKSMAMEVAEELFLNNKKRYLYFIEDYELNTVYFEDEEDTQIELSEVLEEMVKDGTIDYKIGEDGQFYFEVVEKNE
jgi:hypothetical protein